ncbi:hypothetical protein GX618_02590 [Candidatus Dojkabacteria bacterium]|uniref:Intracellular proteinase inhibitor BsuPI domain-containing protein n=1 Tax=Candidatus Dojkabacteria bacterium TaxID=2099670 RepID=A0A847ETZ4_9BACT|nr:hypothetical protein [Candidatus Dojkabacteria bacterium]
MNKILKVVILVLFISSSLFVLYYFGIIRLPNFINTSTSDSEVTITTDKTEYKVGEEINIKIKNNSNSLIYYDSLGDRKWDIEHFKDNKWTSIYFFQVTDQKIGTDCALLLYERAPMAILEPKSEIVDKWNQVHCKINSGEFSGVTSVLSEGQYRFSFKYGLSFSSDNPLDQFSYRIMDYKIIYSESFSVK